MNWYWRGPDREPMLRLRRGKKIRWHLVCSCYLLNVHKYKNARRPRLEKGAVRSPDVRGTGLLTVGSR